MTIDQRVETILRKQLDKSEDEEILPESTLIELGADSLDAVEIALALEEEFDILIPDEELVADEHLTVARVAEVVRDKVAGKMSV